MIVIKKKFIILLFITLVIGVVPSLIVGNSVEGLILPAFYPPKIVFPIVWTILYILMAASLTIVTETTDDGYKIYILQLIFNSLWTVIFFGLKLRFISFLWLIVLFILVIKMTREFYRENRLAGLIQIPYIIWLLIAGYLNLAIYLLNK